MQLELLANHTQHVDTIADWFFGNWNAFYEGRSREDVQADVRARLSREVPLTIVALADDEPIGVVSLVSSFLPTHAHLAPWLADLYVRDDHRSKGVALQLVHHALRVAKGLGIERVHAALHTAEDAYTTQGWEVVDRFALDGAPITVIARSTHDVAAAAEGAISDAS